MGVVTSATDDAIIPIVEGGTNKVIAKSDLLAGVGGQTPVTETGVAVTKRDRLQANWMAVDDTGTENRIRPHARLPRARVKARSTGNMSTSSISTTFNGTTLATNDVLYFGEQTTASENGFYRVYDTGGGSASISKLTELDAVLSAGIYVQVVYGTVGSGQVLFLQGTGNTSSDSTRTVMPAAACSAIDFSECFVDDFVLSGDNTSPTTGNWYPILRRAQAAMAYGIGDIWFSNAQTYRFTQRINCWTLSFFRAAQAILGTGSAIHSPRILFDGCGGFFGPFPGETYDGVAYDTGIRAGIHLEGLYCVFANGTLNEHYGALAHGSIFVRRCTFYQPYGNGIEINTTGLVGGIGLGGNCNGTSVCDTLVTLAGLNGMFIKGGDANNILVSGFRTTNHGTRLVSSLQYQPVTGYPRVTAADNPELTLESMDVTGATGGPTPTLGGTLHFPAGTCPHIRVWVDSVASGTSPGQMTVAYSLDGTLTPLVSGIATGSPVTIGATGVEITFPAGTYSTSYAWRVGIGAGNDWGLRNESFLGCTVINSELSAPSARGGIYDNGSFTAYLKCYTEGGTGSDVRGSVVLGGNLQLRSGASVSRLPDLSVLSTNAWACSGIAIEDTTNGYRANLGVGSVIRSIGLSGGGTQYETKIGSGGNTGTIVEQYGSTNTSANHFWTTTHAAGVNVEGFRRGPIIGSLSGSHIREHTIARASLPANGVPLTSGAANERDGYWPVGSIAWEPNPGLAALGYRVRSNSGSALYTLVWEAIPNPSPNAVALADADATVGVNDGGLFTRTAAVTADRAITISTTGALENDRIQWDIVATGFNITVGGVVVTAGSKAQGFSRYTGGAWVTRLMVYL